MSSQVQTQVDIGVLGLKGLGAFSHVLAAISADNVAPMAMLQMEQLGAVFNVNGKFAAQVPELLTRTSAHPVGRLGLAVGWRRGDAVSLMAESAGGQAASLLSVCITNLYRKASVGDILCRLCDRLLPKTMPSASLTNLADVADLAASKLNRMGFGNVLAEQTMRVMSAYEQLEIDSPKNLLETPSVESIVEVFECLSHLTEEDSVVRVTGSYGILHILGIIVFMFPLDAIVTVESLIIQEGSSRRVVIEICASEPTQIQVEKELNQPPFLSLPIKAPEDYRAIRGDYSFAWEGWLARKLQLEFARYGAICTPRVLRACCNILVHIAPRFGIRSTDGDEIMSPRKGIEKLLGPYSHNRMEQVCQLVLLERPETFEVDFKTEWGNFVLSLEQGRERIRCLCSNCFINGWPARGIGSQEVSCPRYLVWKTIGKVLTAGLHCFLINVRGPVAVPGTLSGDDSVAYIIHKMLHVGTDTVFNYSPKLLQDVLTTFSGNGRGSISRSSGACTIFPTVLETFEVHPDGIFTFELRDGLYIFGGNRYYHSLSSTPASRPKAKESLQTGHSKVLPSSLGEHSATVVTLREGYNELLLQVSVHASGSYFRVDIASVIMGYMGLERARECHHELGSPLSDRYRNRVIITGVSRPRAPRLKLALAMTRSNAAAQFLCCEVGSLCLLLEGCCLDCGCEQAENRFDVLIVP
ncbi:hypothetical protein AJ80_02984 [Polytolypa hystricis UAMH7299]|uniref:Uncharacterized protein n=1 Tax=Polytolypa hystricis (strain UAMH7299) TaxID=1447883 RepID=A0A2B7YNQ7_POLH7|nr:hypothetical protein AJ80_02984 [Polytolypa hystricis UAMH7299]